MLTKFLWSPTSSVIVCIFTIWHRLIGDLLVIRVHVHTILKMSLEVFTIGTILTFSTTFRNMHRGKKTQCTVEKRKYSRIFHNGITGIWSRGIMLCLPKLYGISAKRKIHCGSNGLTKFFFEGEVYGTGGYVEMTRLLNDT